MKKKYREIFKEFRPYRKEFILGPAAKLFEAILELILPILMGRIVDTGFSSDSRGYIARTALLMFAMAAMGLAAAIVCQYCAARACSGVGARLRDRLLTKVNSLTVAQQEKCGVSFLNVAMTSDVNQVSTGVSMFIRLVFRAPFITVGGIVMALLLDAPMSIVIGVGSALFLITLLSIIRVTFLRYKVVQQKLDGISRVVNERLSGIRVVRAFSREKHHQDATDEASEIYAQETISVARYSALLRPITILIMNSAVVLVLWVGGYRIDSGILTTGMLLTFINYIFSIFDELNKLGNLVVIFSRSFVSAERIEGVLELTPERREPETGADAEDHDDKAIVKWKNVSFSYLSDKEDSEEYYALKDVSFELRKGEKLGIIGTTGSGKSTIIALLLRLYDIQKGHIYVDGKSIAALDDRTLRDKMAPVFQTTSLFEGTIRDNLNLGRKEPLSEEELKARCEVAQAWDFICEKGGPDARVEPKGKNFSGGQRQRLSIARALCTDSEILLLDDATAALDKDTSARFSAALSEHAKKHQRTIVEISSKINEIADSDWIIVLDNGAVVGQGKHDALLNECEAYARIAQSQEMGGVE
ncbi:MAG: ABC transporter ATP-binding protein [Clostridiales bacterium]|nr:ABC transporter ATP-binding protein [Clostridiales bacterium]